MAKLTTPISISAIRQALGDDNLGLKGLCTSSNINPFSKYKPVSIEGCKEIDIAKNPDALFRLTDQQFGFVNWGLDWVSNAERTPRQIARIAINGYDPDAPGKTGYTSIDELVAYKKPSGTASDPYRQADFIGYDHNAEHCICGIKVEESGGIYTVSLVDKGWDINTFNTLRNKFMGVLVAWADNDEIGADGFRTMKKIMVGAAHPDMTRPLASTLLSEMRIKLSASQIVPPSSSQKAYIAVVFAKCNLERDTIENKYAPIGTLGSNGVLTLIDVGEIPYNWDYTTFELVMLPASAAVMDGVDVPEEGTYLKYNGISPISAGAYTVSFVKVGDDAISSVGNLKAIWYNEASRTGVEDQSAMSIEGNLYSASIFIPSSVTTDKVGLELHLTYTVNGESKEVVVPKWEFNRSGLLS